MKLKNLRKALDTGQIGAVELTKEYLSQIHKDDCNCYITVCEDEAIKSAQKAQERIDKGESLPMTGIPVSVKDNICTRDIRTTCGSKMLSDFVPFYDAQAVSFLKDQDVVVLGKTNMDEFAMGSYSTTSCFGAVKNPHNKNAVAGGSSGGSAAAVASGLCAAALGSDTGGSVRQPASFCGVAGIKPTYGRVSRYGLVSYASSLEQIGVLATCAEDAGYVLSAISGGNDKDMTCRGKTEDFTHLCGRSLKGVKIALIDQLFEDCSDEVLKRVLEAVEVYKGLGAQILNFSMPSLEYAVAGYYIISSAEASANLARFDGIRYGEFDKDSNDFQQLISSVRCEGFGEEVKKRILFGNYVLTQDRYEKYYLKALKARNCIIDEFSQIFQKCGCVLSPSAATTAPLIECASSHELPYHSEICSVSANMADLPSITVPCGTSKDNMPIGLSITGPKFSESLIISVADAFERCVCV